MIVPHPEDNLSLNITVLGVDIIKFLTSKKNQNKYVLIENVLTDFLKQDDERTPDLFFDSLVFLYSIGLINRKDYKIKLTPSNKSQISLF
ncbi:hypothetical protein V1387_08830 [Allomuricauda taeanensis]|uniref:hypothetical protein n=1 Tax=Flagellimonas taeanensis TaxID=1005926 RepID=UPI002E7BC503|nr:hypothetical protein [Allomuricauda taeanensis]MEE1962785.1 hypothetical protein [Allomuricauda taeanensis]